MEIRQYTKDRITDVLQFERDLRSEESFWGWEIDEKYISDVTASFENPAFQNSLSLPLCGSLNLISRSVQARG